MLPTDDGLEVNLEDPLSIHASSPPMCEDQPTPRSTPRAAPFSSSCETANIAPSKAVNQPNEARITAFSPWNYLETTTSLLQLRNAASGQRDHLVPPPRTYSHRVPTESPFTHTPSQCLPSMDLVVHFIQIADLHLNNTLRFFDSNKILNQLSPDALQFPDSGLNIRQVQLLMIIAFGKLFREKGATKPHPPGYEDFLVADQYLPSHISLTQEPILAVETLCLLSQYSRAVDLHELAYLYVSSTVSTFNRGGITSAQNEIADRARIQNCPNLKVQRGMRIR